jgi:hypothetical protein
MLGHATGQVRMMVLDGQQRAVLASGAFFGVSRRGVIRVQIAHDLLGPHGEQLFVEEHISFKRLERLPVVQVAQVVAEKDMPLAPQGERRLQLPANGKRWTPTFPGKHEWLGRVTAGPTQRQFLAVNHARHGIVAANVNRPIVQ